MPYLFMGCGALFLGIFLFFRDKKGSFLAIFFKTLTSLMFVFTAIFSLKEVGVNKTSYTLIIIGLCFGMIGDVFLDIKVCMKSLNEPVKSDIFMYLGMTSFGVGHILYIISSVLDIPSILMYFYISLGVGLLLIVLILVLSIKVMKMNYGKFLIPCGIYGFLLATFVVFSIFRYVNSNTLQSLMLMIGSIMFIVSDLILSMTYFSNPSDYERKGILNPESRFMIIMNHITYYIAQFLIAISILFV